MTPAKTLGLTVALAAGLFWLAGPGPANEKLNGRSPTVRIGMVNSLFRDIPGAMVPMVIQPFGKLMRTQTGLDGELVVAGDAHALGQQLSEEKLHLGIFHGVEFAWAKEKYPELRPLVIAVSRNLNLRANLVVRSDSAARDFACLKGKDLALPRRSREHCHMFLDQHVAGQGCGPKEFFGKIVAHANVEEALDDVIRGKVEAAVVDSISLELYEQVKAGCFQRLKVIRRSPRFPAAVVAYRQGAMDDATLTQFRQGMLNAKDDRQGRELMTMWKLTSFDPVPADYQKTLDTILKEYPPPAGSPFRSVSKTTVTPKN